MVRVSPWSPVTGSGRESLVLARVFWENFTSSTGIFAKFYARAGSLLGAELGLRTGTTAVAGTHLEMRVF